jgi:hypothetical protein
MTLLTIPLTVQMLSYTMNLPNLVVVLLGVNKKR